MPRPPDTFPNIDLTAARVEIPEGTEPEVLAAGFNSSAWRVGNQVVKVSSQPKSAANAVELLRTMQEEHAILEGHIGDYMTDTRYALGWEIGTEMARVVAVQPFIAGTALRDFLGNPEGPTEPLREFLAKSKDVFRLERLMPDIACIEDGFNVFRNTNIIIREEEDHRPELVDTTFGKTQRSQLLGPLWTRFIYSGAVIAHARLSRRGISQPIPEA